MKKDYNMWPRVVKVTPKKGDYIDRAIEHHKEKERLIELKNNALALLPIGHWTMNNIAGIWTVNLFDNIINSGKETYIKGFTSRDYPYLLEQIIDYIESKKDS